uniref:Uncharacterized protein n=1 Tax=Glossina palpalis gambiensis TaxID=67801 RepID=A0A1B0B416_9MUSC
MVKTSWLYSLRKEELSEICGSLDLDTKGTVEEMRKATTAFITTPDLTTEMKAKLTEREVKYAPRMLQLPEGTVRGASPKRQAQEHISCGAAMDRICKWSVRYDGESGALEFIAGVEELCELFFGDTSSKDLNEIIALGERFEDIPFAPPPAKKKIQTVGTSIGPHPVNPLPVMARGPTVSQTTGSGKVTQQPSTKRSATHRRSGSQQVRKEYKTPSKNSTLTAQAAAKGTRASAVPKISPTPDTMASSSSRHGQTKTLERTTAVRTARTTPLATGDKAAKAATTRPDSPEPKYGTHERVVNATVRLARAFKDLQSVTTREDTTIAITTSRKTGKNKKDKKSKAGKDSGNSFQNSLNNRGLRLHHRPQQGKFSDVALPSPNTFYVSSTNMERTSDAVKQAYIWHNQADKWLPLHEGDPIPNRCSTGIGRSMYSAELHNSLSNGNHQQHVQLENFTSPTVDNSSAVFAASTRHIPESR